MAAIVSNLLEGRITGTTARNLLVKTFNGDLRDINTIIMEENLGFQSLSQEVYERLAQSLMREKPELVHLIRHKGKHEKIQWFLGQMMKRTEGKMEPCKAETILREILQIGARKVKGDGEKGKEKKEKEKNGKEKKK